MVAVPFHEHCEAHNLLPVCQSAYRVYHSTETVIAIVYNIIMSHIEQKNQVSILVLLDLSAAFNTVDHKLLFDALERCFGIQDMALKWFTSYLAERMQTFQVRTDKSKTFVVNCSVSQGSIIGSLKFIA